MWIILKFIEGKKQEQETFQPLEGKYFDFSYWHFYFYFFHFIFFLGCQLQFFSLQMTRLKFSMEFSFMAVLRFVDFPHLGKSKNMSILWKIILSLFGTSNYTLLILVFHKISLIVILKFYRWGKCFLILV